jgi:hypothetical protein
MLTDGAVLLQGRSPCSIVLSATSQQYFSLRTNQSPTTSQQYFSPEQTSTSTSHQPHQPNEQAGCSWRCRQRAYHVVGSGQHLQQCPYHSPARQAEANNTLFAWLISHQPAVLFSHNKLATSNQPAVLFSQNKPAPAISHQPTEQARLGHNPLFPLLFHPTFLLSAFLLFFLNLSCL